MNREIKFRAWDGKTIRYPSNDGLYIYLDGRYGVHKDNGGGKLECELMQYTGLKDKNGKEIYEGDIVEAYGSKSILVKDHSETRRFVSPTFKDEYKFENGRFLFTVYWNEVFSMWGFKPTENRISIDSNTGNRDYKLIGNIKQNPELLK